MNNRGKTEVRPLAKKNGFFSRYRFVYKSSSVLLKCAVLAMLVLSIAALTIIRVRLTQEKQYKDALRVQAAHYEHENQNVSWMIENQDTVEGIKTIAEDKMGKVDGDTVLHDVNTNQD